MLERLNLKLLNILVMDDTNPHRKQLQAQIDDARALVRSSRGQMALCTTFDPYQVESASFSAHALKQIDRDFEQGAVAVKIWKNLGMEIKDRSGQYLMADDLRFEPIYKDIASHGKTLMTHQAEPDVAWGPPDASDPSWSYYRENPQWYVANRPGFPSKQRILDARDHVLANYAWWESIWAAWSGISTTSPATWTSIQILPSTRRREWNTSCSCPRKR
jgi:hypothetical protein